ncbi:hypothetical protein [Aestuariirhabdus sp. LZHN29]
MYRRCRKHQALIARQANASAAKERIGWRTLFLLIASISLISGE